MPNDPTTQRPTNPPRIALITGGTRGIGLGIARCLAREGLALALNGVRPISEVAPVIEEMRRLGVEAHYFRADIGRAEERAALLEGVREAFGRLDVLVNNAGVAPAVRADILDADEGSFERLMRVNLRGPYFLTQAAARWMVEQRAAHPETPRCIVNITSVSAEAASISRGDYCIAKAGLAMATKLWAARLAEYDIPVYEVRPGIIETDMTAGVREKYERMMSEGLLPQARWGTPEDVGRAVAALVRGDLPYSTGAVIPVDGGFGVRRL